MVTDTRPPDAPRYRTGKNVLTLSDSGRQIVNQIAQRHGITPDGVTHMLIAVHNGNGTMAQFNHPDFGGCGQWMLGGMTMVSDLFNNQLKYRVDSICNELSSVVADHQNQPFAASSQSQSQSGGYDQQSQSAGGSFGGGSSLFVPDPAAQWWPSELGMPSATGNQNQTKYAYFADARRLAVNTGSSTWVYDTLDHHIGGFGQQQGGGSSITFTSQYGTVDLSALPVVMKDGQSVAPPQAQPPAQSQAPVQSHAPEQASVAAPSGGHSNSSGSVDQIFDTLERLGALREKGLVTDEEFAETKRELLNRVKNGH